jgi:hypothetical protein
MPEPQSNVRIEYIPPPSEHIEAYGRQVCRELGEEFAEPEVMHGFTQFVKVVVGIIARRLNAEEVDNAADQG